MSQKARLLILSKSCHGISIDKMVLGDFLKSVRKVESLILGLWKEVWGVK